VLVQRGSSRSLNDDSSESYLKQEKNTQELAGELRALREVIEYNTFVRKKYLAFLGKLPKDTLTRDRGASHSSILDIFVHVLNDKKSWFYTYRTGKQDLPETKVQSLYDAQRLESEVDRFIRNFMRKLQPEDVHKPFQFTVGAGPEEGQVITWTLKGMLMHQVEEELQHRGEINALLWQDDIDPPVTSWWRWEQATKKKKRIG
jgi:uncharacterized damage-inducible protein DinB